MKITTNQATPVYTPVTLNLTFDTQDELDIFASLLNINCLCVVLPTCNLIRQELVTSGGNCNKHHARLQEKLSLASQYKTASEHWQRRWAALEAERDKLHKRVAQLEEQLKLHVASNHPILQSDGEPARPNTSSHVLHNP